MFQPARRFPYQDTKRLRAPVRTSYQGIARGGSGSTVSNEPSISLHRFTAVTRTDPTKWTTSGGGASYASLQLAGRALPPPYLRLRGGRHYHQFENHGVRAEARRTCLWPTHPKGSIAPASISGATMCPNAAGSSGFRRQQQTHDPAILVGFLIFF